MSEPKKIHDAIILYLLMIEALSRMDNLNASKSFKKACRTIEGFAESSFKNIENHPELSDIINNDMVQEFSRTIDNFQKIEIV